mmetsp:Transcript_6098/g.18485  ORF Transcript_6098/g.18485 Transcript_6098/m.18485 type:complete len:433 (-) Transcript_6098:864-2162(-)
MVGRLVEGGLVEWRGGRLVVWRSRMHLLRRRLLRLVLPRLLLLLLLPLLPPLSLFLLLPPPLLSELPGSPRELPLPLPLLPQPLLLPLLFLPLLLDRLLPPGLQLGLLLHLLLSELLRLPGSLLGLLLLFPLLLPLLLLLLLDPLPLLLLPLGFLLLPYQLLLGFQRALLPVSDQESLLDHPRREHLEHPPPLLHPLLLQVVTVLVVRVVIVTLVGEVIVLLREVVKVVVVKLRGVQATQLIPVVVPALCDLEQEVEEPLPVVRKELVTDRQHVAPHREAVGEGCLARGVFRALAVKSGGGKEPGPLRLGLLARHGPAPLLPGPVLNLPRLLVKRELRVVGVVEHLELLLQHLPPSAADAAGANVLLLPLHLLQDRLLLNLHKVPPCVLGEAEPKRPEFLLLSLVSVHIPKAYDAVPGARDDNAVAVSAAST